MTAAVAGSPLPSPIPPPDLEEAVPRDERPYVQRMGRGARTTADATAVQASNADIRSALRTRGSRQPAWADDPHAMDRIIDGRPADRTTRQSDGLVQEWVNRA